MNIYNDFKINGSTALKSFSSIQKNRGNRFAMDLSESSLIGILQAYEQVKKKRSPHYSMQSVIQFIKDIEESERKQAETTIMPDGSKAEWQGPFMPIDICSDFWIAFENFYIKYPSSNGQKRHSSGAETYANKIIAALRWSSAYGVHLDPTFNDKKFGKYSKKKITPSFDQISLIYHYDLDGKENRRKLRQLAEEMKMSRFSFTSLKKVRDHFVLSCSLGQRISDSKRLNESNFIGTVYETTQQKTGNHARVDLLSSAIDFDVAMEILKKYNYKAPAFEMDTQHYNKYLHLLCRAIGGPFNQIISWEYKECGEVFREEAPMWKLITSHVSRRIFITNQIAKGKPIPEVMRESGHSDIRNMNTYYAPEHH